MSYSRMCLLPTGVYESLMQNNSKEAKMTDSVSAINIGQVNQIRDASDFCIENSTSARRRTNVKKDHHHIPPTQIDPPHSPPSPSIQPSNVSANVQQPPMPPPLLLQQPMQQQLHLPQQPELVHQGNDPLFPTIANEVSTQTTPLAIVEAQRRIPTASSSTQTPC